MISYKSLNLHDTCSCFVIHSGLINIHPFIMSISSKYIYALMCSGLGNYKLALSLRMICAKSEKFVAL
jgi:hypothetical protein